MYYYQMSLAKRKETGGIRGIASSEYQIGNLLIKMQQYQNALPLLSASKEKYITLKDDMGICINKIDMAAALYYLGRQQEAEDLTEKVFAMISQLENPNLLSRAYTNLAPALAATGNYKTSWQCLQENNHIRESLSLVNREKIIRELEVQFQTRQREEEIRMLQDLNQAQQKNIVLLYLLLAFLFALITLLFIMFRLKATSLKRKSELYEREKTIRQQETQLKEKQQQLLKEQLETKNRELASKALEMLRVNETLGDVIEKLGNLRTNVNGNEQITKTLNSIVCGLEAQLKNNSWNEFEKTLVLFFPFAIMLNGCEKDDENNGSDNHHFTAKVDGVAWSSASSQLIGSRIEDYLFVSGATSNENETISINFFDFPGTTGTYNIGTGEYDFHCFYTIGETSYFVYDDVAGATGTLVITSITDNSVKGSFSFTGFNNDETESVAITDGSFYMPVYGMP